MFTTIENCTPVTPSITNHAFTGYYSYSTLLEAQMLQPRKFTCYELQAATEGDDDYQNVKNIETFLKFVQKGFEGLSQQYAYVWEEDDEGSSWILKQFETLLLLFKWAKKCTCLQDYLDWSCTAYKMFTGKSYTTALNKALASLLTPTTQSGGTAEVLFTLRRAFDMYSAAGDNPLIKRLTSVYSHMLVQGFLERFGLVVDDEAYSKIEQRALKMSYSGRHSMLMSVLELTLFICERVYEWRQTGDITAFLHNGGAYEGWLKEADEVLALAPFTGNLEPHGTNYFKFTSQVADLIERGHAYAKFTSSMSGTEITFVKKRLHALQILKNTEVTKKSAQKERRAPFGVLIHGTSSVAKSTFTKMLFYYYGSLFKLDKEDHYRYVRSPTDEYWTNFDSSKWCVQMDDIAFLLPAKSSEVDPTLKEMLNVVNNVPYVPTQASLEDKGKTPVLARLVLATTNASHLNANEYFYCPLAVRRRLPYVIHIEPKAEYLHANKRFVDPTKLPPITSGFPDYWEITVQKIVPVREGQRDRASLVEVARYSNVEEFLVDFARNARHHEEIQDKAMVCDSAMKDFEVCQTCLHTKHSCKCMHVQSTDISEFYAPMWQQTTLLDTAQTWFALKTVLLVTWFFTLSFVTRLYSVVGSTRHGRNFIIRCAFPYLQERVQARVLGRWAALVQGPRKWRVAIGALSCITAMAGLYLSMQPTKKEEPKEDNDQSKREYARERSTYHVKEAVAYNAACGPTDAEIKQELLDELKNYEHIKLQPQGNVHGTTENQLEKEEKANVWYQPTLELTNFDVPEASRSLMVREKEQIRDFFGKNCFRLKVVSTVDGKRIARYNGAVFLKGQLALTNAHSFRTNETSYEVTVITSSTHEGLNGNITFLLMRKDITFNLDKDIAIFDVRSLPPRKNILPFWGHSDGSAYNRAVSIRRNDDGKMEALDVFKTRLVKQMPIEALGIETDVLLGEVQEPSKEGDCGSLVLAATPRGTIITGLHVVGLDHRVGFLVITIDDINQLMERHHQRQDDYSIVSGEGEPMLNLQNKINAVTVPHHRSLLRYLQSGHLHVYGSFAGFRPRPRSKVCDTPLQAEMIEHFGMEINFDKPAMSGWEPWRNNIVKMVEPTVNYRRDVLDHCVDSFLGDILRELPQGWEKELVFLSKEAALNGLPGVKFIDRINTNSSMGFPWGHTKKQHIMPNPSEKYPEGIDMEPEVWERYDAILDKYAQGKRAFPVFTGHLKDEPTLLRKVVAKKTRVFTAAPIDWSLVVRSRLLSFVRLVQKNKFVFEAGPGTVCQSKEWGEIYDYLTTFGLDRMIAGDYGSFDKKMIADFILACFNLIARIHAAAGFTSAECGEIMCIGYDTAFSVVNFSGDLVEFFGTNPSGHPLTVIVNSIVNSLYMRYVFVVLNPEHTAANFKELVRLFTYGDDNTLGVSDRAPWYNHTTIQAELARIGVEYTMADKEAESIPYINISDIQFLKRTWRFDEDVGNWLCPLDEQSIHKSLTKWLPSGTIDAQAQMVAVISSANSEYFFHGREVFEKHHNFFRLILEQPEYSIYVTTGTLPNWEQLVDRFNHAA